MTIREACREYQHGNPTFFLALIDELFLVVYDRWARKTPKKPAAEAQLHRHLLECRQDLRALTVLYASEKPRPRRRPSCTSSEKRRTSAA